MTEKESMIARVELPPKLLWVFQGAARYRGAYGGRGSGKSRSFAKMAAIKAFQLSSAGKEGIILCAREYMNSLEDSCFAEIKAAIYSEPWLKAHFEIGERFIRTKDQRVHFSFVGLRHNLNSIKSKARVHLLWVDEAEQVPEEAWSKLIPTIREEDSEIWVTWNPERETSATHKRFREKKPENAKIISLNWRDNPWFPTVLEEERKQDLELRPQTYGHIWEGEFLTHIEGAYFVQHIHEARQAGRIGVYKQDPSLSLRAFWDIGGTGARADATSIWIAQFINQEIYVLDYYEAQGQALSAHIAWIREKNYENALMFLPHDGNTNDRVHQVSFYSYLTEEGFSCEIIKNQGSGAARSRIEAVRRLFPKIHFHEVNTKAGLEALQYYHEKRDTIRNIGLGPCHDWSSHAADAFGLMCIAYEQPVQNIVRHSRYQGREFYRNSWMGE